MPIVVLLFLWCVVRGGALDFGVVINEAFEMEDNGDRTTAWTQTATPWFSFSPNDQLSVYLSLDVGAEYTDVENSTIDRADKWRHLFRVNRTQVMWSPAQGIIIEAGRVPFQDPLVAVASGLFDGFKASFSQNKNTLNASVLYAGLQDKEEAKIVMTQGDLNDYIDKDNYFASQRLITSVFGQSRYIGNWDNILDLGVLAQFDLRDDNTERLHSQYVLGKFRFPVASVLDVSTGGIFGIKEQDSGSALSFAFNISASFPVPGPLIDQLSVAGLVSSGSADRQLRPYFPISTLAEGEIFTPSLAALNTAKLVYRVRPLDTVFFNLTGCYFWRTTHEVIPGIAALNNSDKDNLGLELYASGVWAVLSDVALNVGGGAFFPDGPVKEANTDILWKFNIAITLSL
jgi:hypothetical protein